VHAKPVRSALRTALATAGFCLLFGCAPPPPLLGLPGGNLKSAREACNAQYPQRIGNFLPHAQCVNDAVERYAMASEPYPDLIRLQEDIRASLSGKIDRRRITPQTGARRMAEADRLVEQARRERGAGADKAASRRLATLNSMLRE
jgi:hypothetical protein